MRNKNFWPLEVILKSECPLPDWWVFSKRQVNPGSRGQMEK
jgi:hypothetical protein